MSAKHLLVQQVVKKRLRKLPLRIHRRVIESLNQIQANPLIGVKLHGELSDYYKFRLGDYRIIYKFYPKESLVEIVKIEHRQGVYK